MSIVESLLLALKNIVSSKTRTVLTMLGIIIGVAAVIVIVGLGNGLEGYVTDSFSDMGTNTLTVSVESRGSTRTLEEDGMSEMVETMTSMINIIVGVLAGIAAISLVVGGIGIMNIMLVSVTERTREIGIRKAMGAKEKTILAQFVTEAATTSALGGTLGIVLGYIVSAIANQVLPMFTDGMDITVSPSFNSIAAAFGISVFIGVLFGYLPAKRAARLNPIDALRYD